MAGVGIGSRSGSPNTFVASNTAAHAIDSAELSEVLSVIAGLACISAMSGTFRYSCDGLMISQRLKGWRHRL